MIASGQCVLLLVYVDDVPVTGSSTEMIARTKSELKTRFEMTDSGKCAFVLGIELVNKNDRSVTMCQHNIMENNQSCIKMMKNPVNNGRAKHTDIKYHHIRDEVKRGEVQLE